MTRISNRRGFTAVATPARAACSRMRHPTTLVLFDLDGFKVINDELGHDVGDQALLDFARALLDAQFYPPQSGSICASNGAGQPASNWTGR